MNKIKKLAKELGYNSEENDTDIICINGTCEIRFDLERKTVTAKMEVLGLNKKVAMPLNMKELMFINKVCRGMGWLDE